MKVIPHAKDGRPSRFRSSENGFSLLELLTVIAIIGIMATLSSSALSGILGSRGVAGAVNIASSLALNARMEAVKRVENGLGGALLLVDSTPGTNEASMRRMVVVHNVSTNSGSNDWRMAGAPTTLPRGVYFSSEYSRGSGKTNFDFSKRSGSQTGGGTECFYYQFDERGRFKTPGTGEAQLVFIAGVKGADGNLSVKKEASRDGIILRQAGRVTYFQNPDQIAQVP